MSASVKPAATTAPCSARRAGDRLEKYELVRCVARGGMGSVWAAKLHGPHGFEKTVAIKTVLPELAGDPGARAMFLDEARLAAAIDHRNVARVLDFLEHDGALYLVMEWVDGISLMALHERLAGVGAHIPVGIALRVLADVCAGLHAAHDLAYANGEPCGLVHRDVSPHNVLVAVEGSAKLIDFGVAKTRLRVAPDSTFGELRGRIDFMAPEQALSGPLDRRADVWSVGASLFYLLAGHGPFGVCERTESLRRLLAGAPPMPPPPRTHPAVAGVLSGCLALRREDRFPTAGHLAWAIEEAIESMGVAATASDVSAFLADRGVRADPRLVITGHCAIPHELTMLRPDTVSNLRPVGKRPRSSTVKRTLAGLACVCAIGATAVAARSLVRPLAVASPTAPPMIEDVPTAPARIDGEIELPVVVLSREEGSEGHAARPHGKPRAPAARSKAKANHERLDPAP